MSRVVVCGSAVLDFVFDVGEMPRRAEKHRALDARISGGGNAGNAAVAVARLGGEVHMAARLGDDEIADMIVAGLEREGVGTALARRQPGRRSAFSSVFVDREGERQIMGFRDPDLEPRAGWLQAAMPARFDAALADTRWPEGALAVMLAARAIGVPGVIDAEAPVRDADEALAQATHVAFSAQGLRDWAGHDDLARGLTEADRALPGIALVTDGPEGTTWIENGERLHAAARPIEPVDTLAAGDVWHGAFTLRLAEGDALRAAVEYANAAATLKCTRRGGRDGAPTAAELARWMDP